MVYIWCLAHCTIGLIQVCMLFRCIHVASAIGLLAWCVAYRFRCHRMGIGQWAHVCFSCLMAKSASTSTSALSTLRYPCGGISAMCTWIWWVLFLICRVFSYVPLHHHWSGMECLCRCRLPLQILDHAVWHARSHHLHLSPGDAA